MARQQSRAKSGGGRPSGYYLKDGTRVPGVTSILSRYKDSGGIIHWAWELGTRNLDYRKVRDEAAGAGHMAHAMIEAEITGKPCGLATEKELGVDCLTYQDLVDKASKAFEAFKSWRAQNNMEILASEVPLVSEKYRYGGTIDAMARVNGSLVVLDFKSSNRIYSDYLVQVAAYRNLWFECKGELAESIQLLRIGKEFADFHHSSWPGEVLDVAWMTFRDLRACYDRDAVLKRAVG